MATIGIANLGNTCGINTWLQCIFASPSLRSTLIASTFPEGSFGKCLQDVIALWNVKHNKNILVPSKLITFVYDLSNHLFVQNEQLDVGELWQWSLQKLHDEIAIKWTNPLQSFSLCEDQKMAKKIVHDLVHFQNGKNSALLDNSQGVQLSFLKCNACDYMLYNTEPFVTLPLDLPYKDGSYILSDLFLHFFTKEAITEWTCDRCKKKDASRLSRFWSMPCTLILILKRFQMMSDGRFRKNYQKIDIPEQVTFHKGSMLSSSQSITYQLKNIGCHHGSYHYGHYTAVVNYEDTWFDCDDDVVTKIANVHDILHNNQNAYVLIYERS